MTTEIANISVEICCSLFLLTLLGALVFRRKRTRSLLCIALLIVGEIIAVITDLIFRVATIEKPMDGGLYLDFFISYAASIFLVCTFYWYALARFEEKGSARFSMSMRRWIPDAASERGRTGRRPARRGRSHIKSGGSRTVKRKYFTVRLLCLLESACSGEQGERRKSMGKMGKESV